MSAELSLEVKATNRTAQQLDTVPKYGLQTASAMMSTMTQRRTIGVPATELGTDSFLILRDSAEIADLQRLHGKLSPFLDSCASRNQALPCRIATEQLFPVNGKQRSHDADLAREQLCR